MTTFGLLPLMTSREAHKKESGFVGIDVLVYPPYQHLDRDAITIVY